jgi:hypothetical protein
MSSGALGYGRGRFADEQGEMESCLVFPPLLPTVWSGLGYCSPPSTESNQIGQAGLT